VSKKGACFLIPGGVVVHHC